MIKYLIAILLTTTAAYSQTIKTLGYNTTNGQVAYSGSNTLTFTNPLGFSNAAATRTNLGLGASWLTNSNSPATTNATDLTAGTLPDARLSTNVAILSNLPSWATTTNADVARTNLGLGWPVLTNTDATNFRNGIGLGTNQNVTFADITGTRLQVGGATVTTGGFNGPITLSAGQSISFIYGGSPDQTRTNLGLGASWLTNTNVTNFRSAIGLSLAALTNTNVTNFRTDIGLGSLATNNTVPSGAAASNSILTADGAGSSSFVASKTVTVVKSSDQSRTNTSDMTITNNNDPELTQTVTAGDIYYIGVRLEITTGTNSGFNAGIFTGTNNVFSSTSQTIGTAMRHNLNSTTFYVSTGNPVAQITFGGTGVTAAATRNTWTANGVFRCATNGTLTVRWAQNVASNSATTLHAGSSFTLTKLN